MLSAGAPLAGCACIEPCRSSEEARASSKGFPPKWRVRKVKNRVYHVISPAGGTYKSMLAAQAALRQEGDDVCWECRGTGELLPCNDVETLAELSAGVDATKAEASVPADKAMILARLKELGFDKVAARDGVHELNRKLARAVRHGW